MIDMYMGDDQGQDRLDGELDLETVVAGALGGGFGALEEAAVDEDRLAVAELEFVAGTGDACGGAVVEDGWVWPVWSHVHLGCRL